jgi:DNA repair exonuclease SbcCD ATPase subunit
MYIIKIELKGTFSRALEFAACAPAGPSLYIVTGPNGSGKSLIAAAISVAIGDDRPWESLVGAGVEQVVLTGLEDGRLARIVCNVAARRRDIVWEDAPQEYLDGLKDRAKRRQEGLKGDRSGLSVLAVADLFRLVNVCRSGQLGVPRLETLQRAVLSVVKGPLEGEMSGWEARRGDLSGPAGDGGRVGAARAGLEEAEREAAGVEEMWGRLERLRAQQQDLTERLSEVRMNGDILMAEVEELNKLCALADRAARLEAWIEEIRQESREVQKLRERHAELQSRLDKIEERFRGAPDHLTDLLHNYEAARARERAVSMRLVELRAERARRQAELESLRNEAAVSHPSWEDDAVRQQDQLRGEIESVNGELTELLRARIELVRQREGIQQQMARDFAPLAALDGAERARLETVLAREETLSPLTEPAREAAAKERASRIASLQAALREQFAGFERLRPSAPELLREYHDARRVLRTLCGDLDGLRNRIAMLRRKTHPRQSIIGSAGAGVAGFAATAALSSWDIGIFAALTISGLTLLVFRYIHRGVEMEIESAGAAETMIQRRVEETRAAKSRLEKSLGPLAGPTEPDAELRRFQEYVRLREQLAELESEPAREPEPPERARVADLPAGLSEIPLPVLRRLFDTYGELEARQATLENEWRDFEAGGAQAERIRRLEERLENLRARHSALLAALQTRRGEHEARRAEVSARIAELESAPDGEEIARVEAELAEIRNAMAAIEAESGGVLRESTADALSAEWDERETLRARLRETRMQLSAKQTQDELRARQALLAEEMAEMRQKLGALDPLYLLEGTAADYTAKYAGQLRAARSNLSENDERFKDFQRQLETVGTDDLLAVLNNERPLAELQSVAAECRERLESLERDLMTTRELIALISDEIAEKEATLAADLSAALDRWLRVLTDEGSLAMEEREGTWFVDCAEGGPRKLEALSDGTRDLIAIAIRLAVLEVVGDADSNPVIWDEALWRLDEKNLARVREPLQKLAAARQVILFTRFSGLESWGTPLRLEGELQTQPSRAVT